MEREKRINSMRYRLKKRNRLKNDIGEIEKNWTSNIGEIEIEETF